MKLSQRVKDILFGFALGACMCLCMAIYFNRGANPVIDASLARALNMLTIAGMIFGVLMSRNGKPREEGYRFWYGFGTAYKIVAIAALLLFFFTIYLYSKNESLMPLVGDVLAEQAALYFKDMPESAEAYATLCRDAISPTVLGLCAFWQVICGALLPALIVALCFRRKPIVEKPIE